MLHVLMVRRRHETASRACFLRPLIKQAQSRRWTCILHLNILPLCGKTGFPFPSWIKQSCGLVCPIVSKTSSILFIIVGLYSSRMPEGVPSSSYQQLVPRRRGTGECLTRPCLIFMSNLFQVRRKFQGRAILCHSVLAGGGGVFGNSKCTAD